MGAFFAGIGIGILIGVVVFDILIEVALKDYF